jgi:hypothetical protein
LILLAHDKRDLTQKVRATIEGEKSANGSLATGGVQKPGKNFQSSRLAGSIGPKETDHFALRDLKRKVFDGLDRLVLSAKKCPKRTGETRLLLVHFIELREVIDRYLRFHGSDVANSRSVL